MNEEHRKSAERVLGLGEFPDAGAELPRDCVPYLPCSVDALLRMVEQAPMRASDVFVDIGSGVGRAAALVHLLTGAAVIGCQSADFSIMDMKELARSLSNVTGALTALLGAIAAVSLLVGGIGIMNIIRHE